MNQVIYVTGGEIDGQSTKTVLMFCTNTCEFQEVSEMKHKRRNHSSIVVGDTLIVFGGRYDSVGRLVPKSDNIETLNIALEDQAWSRMDPSDFTSRLWPVVCAVSGT